MERMCHLNELYCKNRTEINDREIVKAFIINILSTCTSTKPLQMAVS